MGDTGKKMKNSNRYEVESVDGVGRVDKGKVTDRVPPPKACASA
jgi:hypothetical protein